jgi:hypothetical protein
MKNWLFKLLFGGEYAKIQSLERENEDLRQRATMRRDRRVARFKLEGGLPEDQVARRLAGAQDAPLIQAVMALVDAKIVEMSDRATNPPSSANTPDLRTYEAGGANAIAEFKTRLQELTAATAEEEKPA